MFAMGCGACRALTRAACVADSSRRCWTAGHAQLSSDGFAALKRRYIGYHFSSRHPKGQISTGEIRDLVWMGSDIHAKIKWTGQRALDTQRLSALVGMPQAELEALAARDR